MIEAETDWLEDSEVELVDVPLGVRVAEGELVLVAFIVQVPEEDRVAVIE